MDRELILTMAVIGAQATLESLKKEAQSLVAGTPVRHSAPKQRTPLSADARKRISNAQKKRWAEHRAKTLKVKGAA